MKLGELYRQQGLHNDARAQYMQAADSLMRSGNMDEGTQLYEKILELDPENLSLQTKLAELYLRLSRNAQAGDLLLRLAENSLRRGLLDGAQKALTRLDTLLANDPRVLELKGRLALQRGNPAQAAEFLEKLPALRSSESGLQLLSNAYLQSGAVEKALPVAESCWSNSRNRSFSAPAATACSRLTAYPKRFSFSRSFPISYSMPALLKNSRVASRTCAKIRTRWTVEEAFGESGDVTHSGEILELVAHASVQTGQSGTCPRSLSAVDASWSPRTKTISATISRSSPGLEAPGSSSEENLPRPPSSHSRSNYPEELEEEIRTALAESELIENYSKLPKKAL